MHPHLNVERAANASVSVILLGYLLDLRNPNDGNTEILDHLISLIQQGEGLYDFIYLSLSLSLGKMDPEALGIIEGFQAQSPENGRPVDCSPCREIRCLLPNRCLAVIRLYAIDTQRNWAVRLRVSTGVRRYSMLCETARVIPPSLPQNRDNVCRGRTAIIGTPIG